MTREELKEHCKRQVQQFERIKKIMPVTPNDWKRYEEHKLILELLEKEPRWIPVSERLPEDYEEVIASVDHESVYSGARYSKEFGWEWAADASYDYWTDLKGVDAWMPLPEAYKPESEVKDGNDTK
jgi:hypothetical protein